jgi:hypothetical protein
MTERQNASADSGTAVTTDAPVSRPRRGSWKPLIAGAASLTFTTIASPAPAYMAIVSTSVPVQAGADESQLRAALQSAVKDVLTHAIAFSPTVVSVEKAALVGDRLFLMLFVSDDEGDTSTQDGTAPPPHQDDADDTASRATML